MKKKSLTQHLLAGIHQIIPSLCWQCERFLTREQTQQPGYPFLCSHCFANLPQIYPSEICFRCEANKEIASIASCKHLQPPRVLVISAFWYEEPFQQWIANWKYHSQTQLSHLLGHTLGRAISTKIPHLNVDLILPVPLHKKKLQERGFNQSQLLAYFAFPDWRKKIRSDIVVRTKETQPQAQLSAKERRKNVRRAFTVNQTLSGKSILLIDDVYTTGATLREIQHQLLSAQAKSITCITLARAK